MASQWAGLDPPTARRREPNETHGPTTSACNVSRAVAGLWLVDVETARLPAWLVDPERARLLPRTGGQPAGVLLLTAAVGLVLLVAGAPLRGRRGRGPAPGTRENGP